MHTPFRHSAALAAATLLVLAGCSEKADDSATETPAAEATPTIHETAPAPAASGQVIDGTGYSFTAPEGWTKQEKTPATGSIDTMTIDQSNTHKFPANINVLIIPDVAEMSGEALRTSLRDDLARMGMNDVELKEQGQLDGQTMIRASAKQSLGGLEYLTEQYLTTKDGKAYAVTVSFGTDIPESSRTQTARSILTTWRWTS